MFYENNDNFLEHGIKTFGFGFPLLVKRTKKDPTKIIKAPLVIWNLDIDKSPRKTNEWFIRRSEDYSISHNAVLFSHLESNEQVKFSTLSAESLGDGIVDKTELQTICRECLKKLNVDNYDSGPDIQISKCPNREHLENVTSDVPSIIWSGVFGLYRAQKESIINDLKSLQENFDKFEFGKLKFERYQTTTVCGVSTDPSQEEIINSLPDKSSKIIQGPPGTGKSQSLTALVTNALESKAKCLVVCEKKTALDVIFNNLKNIGLESFCIIVEDVAKDRRSVIDIARAAMEKIESQTISFRQNEYQQKCSRYEELKEEINRRHKAVLAQLNGDDRWKDVVGKYLRARKHHSPNHLESALDAKQYAFNFNEYQRLAGVVKQGEYLFRPIGKLDHPLDVLSSEIFQGTYLASTEENIKVVLEEEIKLTQDVMEDIKQGLDTYGWLFDRKSWISNSLIFSYSLLSKKGKRLKTLKERATKGYENVIKSHNRHSLFIFVHKPLKQITLLSELLAPLEEFLAISNTLSQSMLHFEHYFEWKSFLLGLAESERILIRELAGPKVENWTSVFEGWYFDNLLKKHEGRIGPFLKNSALVEELATLKNKLKQMQRQKIRWIWHETLRNSLRQYRTQKGNVKTLYNYRKNSEHFRKNSLRKIIHTDFDLFTDFFPVVLVNPTVCASIMPLREGLFDIVIFDEASQLRLEDTFSSLVRGKYKIVSGDRHQMPPSSYFMGTRILTEVDDYEKEASEEESEEQHSDDTKVLAESESLLKFAEDSGYAYSYLDFHYRSRHPFLIDFSNAAFYGSRLVPMPEQFHYRPIRLIQVNGVYEKDGTNPEEARQIVRLLADKLNPNTNGVYPSIGVATFNIYQRNLILDLIREESILNPAFADKYQKLLERGLFVKNLENIQGDERDIIIISTTFGQMADGSFRQNFGPINQQKGYRLLNVIITRAKHQLFVLTSIPSDNYIRFSAEIEARGNIGRGIFYAYLSYAKAIEERDDEKRIHILELLRSRCSEPNPAFEEGLVESPFEQEVYDILCLHIDPQLITCQHRIGGFRVDFTIKSPTKTPLVAIECDGKTYHSSNEAYAHDVFRQEQLEQLGLKVYRIWSTNWWRKTDEEIRKLLEFVTNTTQAVKTEAQESPLISEEWLLEKDEPPKLVREAVSSYYASGRVLKVGLGSLVTIRDILKNELLKIKFTSVKKEENLSSPDIKVIHKDCPLGKALWNKSVGEVCRLDGIEAYYEIVDLKAAS